MKMILSSPSTATFHLRFSPTATTANVPSSSPLLPYRFLHSFAGGNWRTTTTTAAGALKDEFANLQCKAVSKPRTQEYAEVVGLPLVNWQQHEIVDDDLDTENITTAAPKICVWTDKIKEYVETIKTMLGSMNDGEITISAYDTAWVALVPDVNGNNGPQFPSSLQWIVDNQLPDGSWGDILIFSAHDRIINTLACVIALTSWNIHPDKCQKGMSFVKDNIYKLEDENEEHMPIGFEVAFPSLIEIAQKLNIQVPKDSPVLEEIYARRNIKLTKIPKDIMHRVPTTLLHSLEGMPDLEWEKLLKLQCKDGSFLFSPSSTAFALINTKDKSCLTYLTNIVTKFNGGVPNVYPVDLFEHIWAVDRLQRLGISRYFQSEINDCVEYIHRYWTKDGICWAKNSNVQDIDDTAMAFRVLRMNGYQVSPDVFRQFEKDGKFVCFVGQSTQAVTGMFNLLRASQVLFPGEKILEDAKKFSSTFLREKQSTNEIYDKWIIAKDLPGEVAFALDVPWYATLPRVETRYYLEQYGGEDDVWIGKTLYRMPIVSNNTYLEMAKLDYNNCLAMHQLEWNRMRQWYADFHIEKFSASQSSSILLPYYLAAASIFEAERSKERIAWAKTMVLMETISSFFTREELSGEDRRAFVEEFKNTPTWLDSINRPRSGEAWQGLVAVVLGTLNQLELDALVVHGQEIRPHLRRAWETWLTRWQQGGDVAQGQAELIVLTINMSSCRWVSEDLLSHPQYQQLSDVTNNLCHQISKEDCTRGIKSGTMNEEIESKMQELVQLVLCDTPDDLDPEFKQIFLTVAKTFYYKAYCDPEIINVHISKVLFENVA